MSPYDRLADLLSRFRKLNSVLSSGLPTNACRVDHLRLCLDFWFGWVCY